MRVRENGNELFTLSICERRMAYFYKFMTCFVDSGGLFKVTIGNRELTVHDSFKFLFDPVEQR